MKKISLLFAFGAMILVAACSGTTETEYAGEETLHMDADTSQLMTPENPYYDTETYRPSSIAEKTEINDKWTTSRMETRWQEYKGSMIRVQILLGASDLREMRLKLIQNANGMDTDADARVILGRVADFEMKKVCGRNTESIVTVYDKPSFEVLRPTPYFDYKETDKGVTMREYGFRCVYK